MKECQGQRQTQDSDCGPGLTGDKLPKLSFLHATQLNKTFKNTSLVSSSVAQEPRFF